jgi:sialic acid synthase SpsE
MEFNDCKIVAEVSSNHSGDMDIAKEFIRVASRVGAEYVKFQSSRYEDLIDHNDPQAEWVRKTSLSDEDHYELIQECKKNNIKFLTTCFSINRVDFLSSLELDEIKVASPDLLSFSMIEKLARHFRHLIISTGMHSIKQMQRAIRFLLDNKINATLLHTVSLYPTPLDKTFMYKFLWLKSNFPKVGYSNHTPSLEAIRFAMANGARIIEAHMKLSEEGLGRTTPWDLLPSNFREIVSYRETLVRLRGSKDYLSNKDFLFPEENIARKRFIGRWGDNK